MKQFPKQNNKQSDSSAHLELQIQQIILTHSDKQGNLIPTLIFIEQLHVCMLIDSVDDKKDLWLIYELC